MKKFALVFTVLALWILGPTRASALTVELVPSATTVQVGTSIRIDVVLRDFLPGTTPVIGDFDFFTKFDPASLASTTEALPVSVVFGSTLGVPGTESSTVYGVNEDITIDIVRIYESSGLSATSLSELQTDSTFILGSLFFDAVNQGISEVMFTSASIGGAPILLSSGAFTSVNLGPRLPFVQGAPIVITVTSVPEPHTYVLLLAGLALVHLTTKARRNKLRINLQRPKLA